MKNKGLSLTFLVFTLCLFSFAKIAKAAPPTGGLWGQYSKGHLESDSSKPDKSELKDVSIENLDFDNFDEVLKQQRIGQRDDAEIIWRGGIYADSDGEYSFRLDVETSKTVKLTIDDKSVWNQNVAGDRSGKITLKKGWHKFVLWHIVYEGDVDSKVRLFWKQPGGKEEIVPSDHLTYKFWSDNVLTIPSDGTKKKLDYIVAGAGVDGEKDSGGLEEGKIIIDMPGNVLDSDVWAIWYKQKGESNKLVIKNENTGDSKTVTGQSNLDSMGFEADYPEVYARVPASLLVDDGVGKLNLSFKKESSSLKLSNGISLVVPFENNTKPEGKLSIRMVAATGFRGAGPVMTFPVTPKSKINPMFFFPNGESKTGDKGFRPNYLVVKTGSGNSPKESASLFNDSDAELIVPQVSSSISKSNTKTWYPLYGREGRQLDVISSRYVPNQWYDVSSQYSGNQDGKIDEIEIPEGHTWVAFQYVGSNFASDGQDGRPESGSISGGGLFSEKDLDEFDLKVNVTGSGDVQSNVGGINCPTLSCEDDYADGTNVTLTATAHTGSSFAGWSGDCAFAGTNTTCTLTVDAEKTVNATFSLTPTPTVGGICGNANGSAFCSEPKNKCYLGTVVDLQYSESSKKWTWKCKDTTSGVESPLCSAQKNCQIQEVTP